MILRALRALWTYAVLCYGFGLLGVAAMENTGAGDNHRGPGLDHILYVL